jgi:AcrR family transcriptional regulator
MSLDAQCIVAALMTDFSSTPRVNNRSRSAPGAEDIVLMRNSRCVMWNTIDRRASQSMRSVRGPKEMPKIVDVDATRRRIVEAAWAVIATEGIQSVSMRRVAREAGCTSGLITHHFADKDELVTSAYEGVLDEMIQNAARQVTRARSVADKLCVAVEAIEPTSARLKQLTIVLMNFWAQAAFNPVFAARCRQDYKRWRALVSGIVRDGIGAGELRGDTDVQALTDAITLLSDGLSVGMTLTPNRYGKRHRRVILMNLLRPHLA